MSSYFQRFVVPLAALFIAWRILLFLLGKIYPSAYAYFCYGITSKHHKLIRKQKGKLFSDLANLRGKNKPLHALEIGVGPGNNFEIYPQNTSLTVLEPNVKFEADIAKNVADYPGIKVVKTINAGAEDLREYVDDSSQDVVVCTLTLCSVPDIDAVVREARRVLKQGGRFYFIEHTMVHTKNFWIRLRHMLFIPIVYLIADCRIYQTPWVAINRAGFSEVYYTKTNENIGISFFKPHVFGYAVK